MQSSYKRQAVSGAVRGRRVAAAGLGLAFALVMTGCGGSDESAETAAAGQSPAASESTASEASKQATPSATAGSGSGESRALTGEELAQVMSELNLDLELGGTLVEEDELKAATAQSVDAMREAEYTPCNPSEGTDLSKASREAGMVALAIDGNDPVRPDSISVLSWPDEQPVIEEIEASKVQLAACPEFTLSVGGTTVSSSTETVEMPQVGDASQAYLTRASANGQTQTSLIMTAWSGSNSVQITLNEADPVESVRYVTPILEEVLHRLEG